jgi:repressor LexA
MPAYINTLTSKQKKVYFAIESYTKSKGIPPTVREIGEMLGEKTPGAVQGILNRLEQKGVIKREVGMARSIQIVSEDSQYAKPVYIPEIKKISQRNIDDLFNMYNIVRYQPMPTDYISNGEKAFIIDCPDNSLYESGITYEDKLILTTEFDLVEGDIVLVVYDNHVLLRKYHDSKQESSIILKADSNLLEKELFNNTEVTIVGKLIGKFSKY